MNSHPHGYFLNTHDGYKEEFHHREWTFWIFPTVINRFSLNLAAPLMYYDPDLRLYVQPNRVFLTDDGSVPWLLQKLCPKNMYPHAFPFHDSEYRFKGIWISDRANGTFSFTKTTRADADERLRRMVMADGGPEIHSTLIYAGVTFGGAFSYGKGDLKRKAA